MTPPTQQDKPIDLEALRLAAEAAGLTVVGLADDMVVFPGTKAGGLVIRNEHGGDSLWNPRTDDGDALRLAVKLHLNVCSIKRYEGAEDTTNVYSFHHPEHSQIGHGSDMMAATRHAITQVAAEIGKSMP
jgi:hypothetical protein